MATVPTKYICDRDGIEAMGGPNPLQPPDGWAVVSLGMNWTAPQVIHLCPACREGLVAFIGGKFKFEPVQLPPILEPPKE